MPRIGWRRKSRVEKLWSIGRQGGRVVFSIVLLAAKSAMLGVGVASIAIAVVDPPSAEVQEGRSATSWPSLWGIGGDSASHAGPPSWQPRGEARICRSWCEIAGSGCVEVCVPAKL